MFFDVAELLHLGHVASFLPRALHHLQERAATEQLHADHVTQVFRDRGTYARLERLNVESSPAVPGQLPIQSPEHSVMCICVDGMGQATLVSKVRVEGSRSERWHMLCFQVWMGWSTFVFWWQFCMT